MSAFVITARHSAEAIARDLWERLCPPGDPFLNTDFLATLERHGTAGRALG